QVVNVKGALDDQVQGGGVYGFFVVVVGAHGHGLDGVLMAGFAGHHNDFAGGGDAQYVLYAFKAFFHAVFVGRQAQILDDDRGFVEPERGHRVLAVFGDDGFVLVKVPAQLALQATIVFHNHVRGLVAAAVSTHRLNRSIVVVVMGSVMVMMVPSPGALNTWRLPPSSLMYSRER